MTIFVVITIDHIFFIYLYFTLIAIYNRNLLHSTGPDRIKKFFGISAAVYLCCLSNFPYVSSFQLNKQSGTIYTRIIAISFDAK